MSWSASKIFTGFMRDALNQTTAMDWDTDAVLNVALYDDSITPSQTVASASSAYATGVWAGGHITDTGGSAPNGWPTVGRPLVTPTVTAATVTPVMFDAVDTASLNSTTTLAATNGCLVYDDSITTPVAKQGFCYNYFGGPNSVTLGSFTIVWNVLGIFAITL